MVDGYCEHDFFMAVASTYVGRYNRYDSWHGTQAKIHTLVQTQSHAMKTEWSQSSQLKIEFDAYFYVSMCCLFCESIIFSFFSVLYYH